MNDTVFSSGTVISSAWLNDLNRKNYKDTVSLLDCGGSPNDPTFDNADAFDLMLSKAAANGARAVIGPGTWWVGRTIRIPSNITLSGAGRFVSIVKMFPDVGRQFTVMQTGTRGQKVSHVTLEDFSVDFNRSRWSVEGLGNADREDDSVYGGKLDTNATSLSICFSEYIHVKRVASIDGYKHCLDVQAPRYLESASPHSYDPEPSRFVWIEDCYASGAGDDNFTTHYSTDLWITRCVSLGPSGVRTPGNSNCFEIDDGTRNVYMAENFAQGGICGLQIKGHNYAPAPYNVTVNGFRTANNTIGVEIRHTGFYGGVVDDDGFTETEDENGNAILYTGVSPTARNITLTNIEVIAPRAYTTTSEYPALYAFRCRSYQNVTVDGLRVSDGVLDLAGDYLPSTALTGYLQAPIRFYNGTNRVTLNQVTLSGFSTSQVGLSFTSSLQGDVLIDGFVSVAGPRYPIRASGPAATYRLRVDNYSIQGSQADGIGIFATIPNAIVGDGFVVGYSASVASGVGVNNLALPGLVVRRRMATSDNTPATFPQPAVVFVSEEAAQNIAAGEGMALQWRVKLVDDATSLPVAAIGSWKLDNTDTGATARLSSIRTFLSADGTAAPVPTWEWLPSGELVPVGAARNIGQDANPVGTAHVTETVLNGSRVLSGTGTPEAAVTAPVGSMYLRKDGAAGTTLYIKETGVGNTGWVAK
jgi:hypothetical protein